MGEAVVGAGPALVAAVLAVPGIAAAALLAPTGAGPDAGALQLTLAPGADATAVAAAVVELLRARAFGVAPLPAPRHAAEPSPLPGPAQVVPEAVPPSRLAIERVQVRSAGLGVDVVVTLRLGERSWPGEASTAATPTAVHRAVAVATARAVEQAAGGALRLEVEQVEIVAGGRTALAVLTLVTERATERLSGASVVREDVRQAVIRATLAAVNRRLESHLPRDGGAGIGPGRAGLP